MQHKMPGIKNMVLVLLVLATSPVTIHGQSTGRKAANQRAHKSHVPKPQFRFVEGRTHDMGLIDEGADMTYVFYFRNIGKVPLIITSVSASSSYVETSAASNTILPGASGQIEVIYHSRGRPGSFLETIYIKSNVVAKGAGYRLFIKGTVQPSS